MRARLQITTFMTRFRVRLEVSGAQHAEATLDRIGSQHAPIVREL